MSCQCGCGRLLHLLDPPEKPHFELHVEIVVTRVSLDEWPAFFQHPRWWVMKKGDVFGTPKFYTPREAIEFIPVLTPIWRGPWITPYGRIG